MSEKHVWNETEAPLLRGAADTDVCDIFRFKKRVRMLSPGTGVQKIFVFPVV